ncbi:MAG: leucyl aminopeptidase [Rickettsiales bacterium]|jgi:leucyl aminopeptidase|nr:leucyl aminopeptidase [Rickettsiales bacterium]
MPPFTFKNSILRLGVAIIISYTMKVFFKGATPESGILVSLYTEKFFKKNKELSSKTTFRAGDGKKIITCSEDRRIEILVGLGDNTQAVELRHSGWKLFEYMEDNKFEDIVLSLNNCAEEDNDEKILDLLFGIELADYRFNKYLNKENKDKSIVSPKTLTVIVKNIKKAETSYRDFSLLKNNVFFCRDLVNEPANAIGPESYSQLCRNMQKYGLEVDVLGEKKLRELGMNLLLSVGEGSSAESKVVLLKWKGLEEFENPVALVGKGVTFDSGGISLKGGKSMYDMKCDMAGSAVVVSTLKLLAERKAKINVIGAIGLVENMPSGQATRPGDIIKSLSGQTVEILNTDAEGRLVLADLLYYVASQYKPDTIIDLATLTGSIISAIGPYKAGLFSNNRTLAENIRRASEDTGEYCWEMPLDKIGGNYDKMINSEIADMKNITTAAHSGSITAAQFLQKFIADHPKWAHLDIAGTAFIDDKKCFFVNSGATGYGVRLIDSLLRNSYEK